MVHKNPLNYCRINNFQGELTVEFSRGWGIGRTYRPTKASFNRIRDIMRLTLVTAKILDNGRFVVEIDPRQVRTMRMVVAEANEAAQAEADSMDAWAAKLETEEVLKAKGRGTKAGQEIYQILNALNDNALNLARQYTKDALVEQLARLCQNNRQKAEAEANAEADSVAGLTVKVGGLIFGGQDYSQADYDAASEKYAVRPTANEY